MIDHDSNLKKFHNFTCKSFGLRILDYVTKAAAFIPGACLLAAIYCI